MHMICSSGFHFPGMLDPNVWVRTHARCVLSAQQHAYQDNFPGSEYKATITCYEELAKELSSQRRS